MARNMQFIYVLNLGFGEVLMNYIRLLGIAVLFVFVGLGTVGGCGSSGGSGDGDGNGDLAGEINCMDGIDNDGDTQTDCDDIDCILDPVCNMPVLSCEDIKNAFCERSAECFDQLTVELCLIALGVIEDSGFECEEIFNLSNAQDCVADLDNFDCQELDIAPPVSCSPEGVCDICVTDNDCNESQLCFGCFENCTGAVDRCSGALPYRCEDGLF